MKIHTIILASLFVCANAWSSSEPNISTQVLTDQLHQIVKFNDAKSNVAIAYTGQDISNNQAIMSNGLNTTLLG